MNNVKCAMLKDKMMGGVLRVKGSSIEMHVASAQTYESQEVLKISREEDTPISPQPKKK